MPAIDGYPLRNPELTGADLEARRHDLERRVPGWTVSLTPQGYPHRLEGPVLQGYENRVSSSRVQAVEEVLRALAGSLGLDSTIQTRADGPFVGLASVDGATSARFVIQQASIAPDRIVLRIESSAPPPTLPAGARELTDEEIRASWELEGNGREVHVHGFRPTPPCDPVVGYEHVCESVQQPEIDECLPLAAIRLARVFLESPEGTRRVVRIDPCIDRAFICSVEMALPKCIDAVTGEHLPRC